jgi:putative tryptophan/tyrosine transport system substrate-binding protein
MQRREFITLLGTVAAAAWPFTTLAQQSERMRRVGVVMNLPEYDIEARLAFQVLRTRLQELGWAESNLKIDFRWVGEQVGELPAIVKDLVGLRPDVIVGRSGAVLLALHHETSTIPIVFVGVVDPVEVGLVESLARPGGNITGFATFDPAMGTKWFQIIKEIDPSLKRVAVLLHPQQSQELILKEIEGVAPSFSAQVTALRVHNAGEIENSINNFASGTDGGLIVLPNSVTNSNRELIANLAARYRMPAVYAYRSYVITGGLASYGIEASAPFRDAAGYVDRILKGEKPGDLPVQAPTKFELVINLKAAKAIGLTIPFNLLTRADEVIE